MNYADIVSALGNFKTIEVVGQVPLSQPVVIPSSVSNLEIVGRGEFVCGGNFPALHLNGCSRVHVVGIGARLPTGSTSPAIRVSGLNNKIHRTSLTHGGIDAEAANGIVIFDNHLNGAPNTGTQAIRVADTDDFTIFLNRSEEHDVGIRLGAGPGTTANGKIGFNRWDRCKTTPLHIEPNPGAICHQIEIDSEWSSGSQYPCIITPTATDPISVRRVRIRNPYLIDCQNPNYWQFISVPSPQVEVSGVRFDS